MEDHTLLNMLFARQDSALQALLARFGKRLYQTAYNILGSKEDAEEIVNDALLAIWNAIPPAHPEPLEGYVYRTGRNIALKKLRFDRAQKRSSGYAVSIEELSSVLPGEDFGEALDSRLLGQAIDRFLDTLPQKSRILFLRRYWFGDSVKSLSQEFHITENAVSVRLSRIRAQLQNYLSKEGFSL